MMLSILLVLLLLLVGLVLIQQYFGLPILARVRARLYMEDIVWHGLGKSPSTHILNSEKAVDTWIASGSVTAVAAWACDIVKNKSNHSFFVMPLSSRHDSLAQNRGLHHICRSICPAVSGVSPCSCHWWTRPLFGEDTHIMMFLISSFFLQNRLVFNNFLECCSCVPTFICLWSGFKEASLVTINWYW